MSKLSQTAKTLDWILKIAFGLTIAMGIFFLVCTVCALILPADIITGGVPDLVLGSITLEFAEEYRSDTGLDKLPFVLTLLTGVLMMGFACYVITLLRGLTKPMIADEPFHETVAVQLRKLSWATLIGGGGITVLGMLVERYTFSLYDLDALFSSELITGYAVEYTVDLTFLIGFIVLRLAAFIFQYGAELQKQSDETL